MPLYEYECKACGHVQEILQKISDPAPEQCRSCQKGPLSKLMSKTSFVLKGDGWYVTDFRDKNSKPASASSKKEESSPTPAAPATASDKT